MKKLRGWRAYVDPLNNRTPPYHKPEYPFLVPSTLNPKPLCHETEYPFLLRRKDGNLRAFNGVILLAPDPPSRAQDFFLLPDRGSVLPWPECTMRLRTDRPLNSSLLWFIFRIL